jgi:uncharacterized protein
MSAIDPSDASLVVIAKAPLPGHAKTRLIPGLGESGAAALATACLEDTLWAVVEATAKRRVLVLAGDPGPAPEWLPRVAGREIEVWPQRDGDLGNRLAGALADTGATPALLVGMDTPQINASLLEAAIAELCADGVDAVLGPASDGGWWAIGLREADETVFDGVPMSSSATGASQRRRLADLGLSFRELEQLRDIDTLEDARAVAATNPWTRMAAALWAMSPEESSAPRPVPPDDRVLRDGRS